MNDDTVSTEDGLTTSGETQLLAEKFDEYKEALEVLYLIANQSGRILFAQNWPETARLILGEELIRFDTEGTQDIERRAELEGEADMRRVEMLEVLDSLEERCVVEGVLQLEYVKGLVVGWGRGISLYVFSSVIVDRFLPAPAPVVEAVPEVQKVEPEVSEPAAPINTDIPPSVSAKPATAGTVMQDEPAIQYDTEVAPVQPEVKPADTPAEPDASASFTPQSTGKKKMTFVSSKARKEQKNSEQN